MGLISGVTTSYAQECQKRRPGTLIQEDKAPAHNHHHQGTVYELHHVACLLWPGNSPDLNAIEPCWPWMKKTTTARGAPTTRSEMEKAWIQAWLNLPQSEIQAWIERIPRHIQEIIRLEGGNEYAEGRKAFKRDQAGIRIKGKLSRHRYLNANEGQNEGQGQSSGIATGLNEWQDASDSNLSLRDSDETDSD